MRFRQAVFGVLVATALTACTRSNMVAELTNNLRVGISDEPDSLNPLFSHTAVADDIAALTLAPLFRYDDHGDLVPELATRVPTRSNGDVSADGKSLTLRIRPHLRWSDGHPLDAGDLIFTWHAVMNPANNTKLRSGWDNIVDIKATSDTTALVRLHAPDATILSLFAGGGDAAYPILPEHAFPPGESLNKADFNAAPLSSGPWTMTSWKRGSSLSLVPNTMYWRGAPQIHGITFLIFPQTSTMMTALQTHDVDYVDAVPEDRLAFATTLKGVTLKYHTVATYRHLDFNMRDPLLRDVRMRRALVEAVDWNRLLHTVYHDAGQRAQSDIFPLSFAAPEIPFYRFDPAHAGRLLDEAGWTMNGKQQRVRYGIPLSFTIMSANTKATSLQAELQIAAYLQRIGVQLQTKNVPASYLFAQDGPLYTGHYQLAWAADTRGPDPDNAANWVSSAMPPNGANTVYLSDAVVDRTAGAARITFDQARRRALYAREETRLHELIPSFIFTWQRAAVAMTPRLTGVRPAPFYTNFWNSWQWRLK